MKRTRRRFSDDQKQDLVRRFSELHRSGLSQHAASKELGIDVGSLRDWSSRFVDTEVVTYGRRPIQATSTAPAAPQQLIAFVGTPGEVVSAIKAVTR